VQVVKRPVDLSVTCAPSGIRYTSEETVWFVGASCDTCIMGNVNVGNIPSYGIQSGMLGIGVAYSTSAVNQLFRTYIKFYVPPKHPDALFTSVYLMLYGFANVTVTSGYMPPDENSRHYYAYIVTEPWNPSNLTWYNQPSYNQTSGIQGLDYDSDQFLVTSTTTEICFDITQAFQQWYNGAAQNFGLVIMDENEAEPVIGQNWHGQWVWEAYSKEISGPLDQVPQLTTCYSRPTGYVTVMATDPVAGGAPIQNLSINDYSTDAIGEVSWPLYPSGLSPLGVLSGEYESSETAIYRAANISVTLDARYPTCLTSLNGSVVTGLPSGYSTNAMAFRLSCPSREENLTGVRVDFYVDPPNMNLWDFDPSYWADTDSNGVVWLSYEFSAGTHYIYALFDGYDNTLWQFEEFGQLHQYYYGDWYQPCNVSTVAVASVIPLGVDFSVSRQNFAPGAQLVLNATVIDLRYNDSRRYTQPPCNVNFTEINRYGIVTNHAVTSTSNGVALWRINYPSDGVGRAYKAVIVSAGDTPQNIISSPLQLTVGYDTTLLLSVTRDFNSTRHVFTCRLLSSGGSPVCGKNITLTLNSTSYITQQYPSLRTNASGYAWIALYLSPQADNNQTVYNVVASFAGDSASTATATLTTINRTTYDVCTTTQYNTYEPCSNSTSITVTPQTTRGATTLESSKQMQQYAQSKGWLTFYNEWSWAYPWYRLHAKITIGAVLLDIGFSPALPFGTTFSIQNIQTLASTLAQINAEIWQDVMLDFWGVFMSYVVAKGFGLWGLEAGLLIEIIKGGVQYGFFARDFFQSGAGSSKMLAYFIADMLMGLIAIGTNIGETFVKTLQNILWAATYSAIMLTTSGMITYIAPLEVVRTPVDYFESCVVDFPIAAFALLRFLGVI
jgi:hypothetical protein